MKRKTRLSLAGLACLLALASGCVGTPDPTQPEPVPETNASRPELQPEQPPAQTEPPEPQPVAVTVTAKGTGNLLYDGTGGDTLNTRQDALLVSYMDLYHQSLADLKAYDPADLFTADAADAAATRMGVWETMIQVRSLQTSDLTIRSFSYTLTITDINENDDGDLSISAEEYAKEHFAQSGAASESFGIRHRFTLANTADGWRIRSHSQMDMANMLASGRWGGSRGSTGATSSAGLQTRRAELLAQHRENLADRGKQADAYDPAAATALSWDHAYDRAAAVDYAMQWVGVRNSASWPSYDRNGGNCQNYTSQCLYVGGIPMDYSGASQWKWYGSTPSTAQSATGRSGSWSSVSEFYAYASRNTGYGLVAEADANFWSGEKGDLIQLGYGDNWRHVVIITDVIRDSSGNAVDYLINSNTADLRNYPVSAYLYPQQRLIRIHGWNEA